MQSSNAQIRLINTEKINAVNPSNLDVLIVPKVLASDSVGLNNVQSERRAKNHGPNSSNSSKRRDAIYRV
jgi:hypothetical protein